MKYRVTVTRSETFIIELSAKDEDLAREKEEILILIEDLADKYTTETIQYCLKFLSEHEWKHFDYKQLEN